MPVAGKKGEKCLTQSYCLTITSPSSFLTSWAWLMEAESSTTFTRSCRHPTSVLLNRCFRRPNAQSGANLVWPTIMKLISTCLLRPAITRHAKYCIIKLTSHVNIQQVGTSACTYRFLFCPLQLSACRCRFVAPKPLFSRK